MPSKVKGGKRQLLQGVHGGPPAVQPLRHLADAGCQRLDIRDTSAEANKAKDPSGRRRPESRALGPEPWPGIFFSVDIFYSEQLI